jgi:hypothetical protein
VAPWLSNPNIYAQVTVFGLGVSYDEIFLYQDIEYAQKPLLEGNRRLESGSADTTTKTFEWLDEGPLKITSTLTYTYDASGSYNKNIVPRQGGKGAMFELDQRHRDV